MKENLFSVTAKDCDFEPYKGSGAGGQKKNKTSSAMRCIHRESGATGQCENYREQPLNKKEAFKRMSQTKKFQDWIRIEAARKTGELLKIEEYVENEIKRNVLVECKDENGKWVKWDNENV